jgi:O-antigen ligase
MVLFLLISKKFFNPKNIVYIPATFLFISLTFPFFSKVLLQTRLNFPQNISQRIELSFGAGSMISQKFLLGEGLNTFVINEPRIKYLGSYLWTLQPVHNIFLLVFSETGIFGLLFVYILLVKSNKKALLLNHKVFYLALVFILTTGLVDHYWFTLQQNMFLLAFVFGNSFRVES